MLLFLLVLRCRYEKQARLKRYAQSPKEKYDDSKMPITIPIHVSDEPKGKQTPVIIPVGHTSISSKFLFTHTYICLFVLFQMIIVHFI